MQGREGNIYSAIADEQASARAATEAAKAAHDAELARAQEEQASIESARLQAAKSKLWEFRVEGGERSIDIATSIQDLVRNNATTFDILGALAELKDLNSELNKQSGVKRYFKQVRILYTTDQNDRPRDVSEGDLVAWLTSKEDLAAWLSSEKQERIASLMLTVSLGEQSFVHVRSRQDTGVVIEYNRDAVLINKDPIKDFEELKKVLPLYFRCGTDDYIYSLLGQRISW